MNTSSIDICNLALIKASIAPINSLEATSKEAINCRHLYPKCKRSLLAKFPFNFALKIEKLNPVEKPVFNFSHCFLLPADFIHLQEADVSDRQIIGREIHANSSSLTIKYVSDVDNPNYFSADFTDILVLHLAAELSLALRSSNDKYTIFMQEAQHKLRSAINMNIAENPPLKESNENIFLDARG